MGFTNPILRGSLILAFTVYHGMAHRMRSGVGEVDSRDVAFNMGGFWEKSKALMIVGGGWHWRQIPNFIPLLAATNSPEIRFGT